MKRRTEAAFLVLIFAFAFCFGYNDFAKPASAQGNEITLTFHYHRYSGDYDGWNMWIWEDGKDGAEHKFTDADDYGKIVKVKVPSDGRVGFIVRKGNWAEKDVSADRFINTKVSDMDVWLIQGDAAAYEKKDDADISAKFLSASFKSQNTVTGKVTEPVAEENNVFAVLKDGHEIGIVNNTKANGTEINIKLDEDVEFGKNYVIRSDYYGDKVITSENLFGTKKFEEAYFYDGELGALYKKERTVFRVWSPVASSVNLKLYKSGDPKTCRDAYSVVEMAGKEKGLWETTVDGDLKDVYYTYEVTANGLTNEAVDPYAKAAGVNGVRGMVADLKSTDPDGWDGVTYISRSHVDSVIYEAHIRDLTVDPSSGVSEKNRGKFLGMTEKGTKNPDGQKTALSYLADLGITELHLLPIFDYATVDESSSAPQFNWGYDPLNYNVPEGSYSSDPYDGNVRINELKRMVKALHEQGIRVVMDVVYNHTSKSADSNLNLIVPGYYYRMTGGKFSNGSGCGNETASERCMYRKFMIDSVCYWTREYKIDGFRFDLMGLHDIDTMNVIAEKVREINPDALLYGEGWTGGTSPLAESKRAVKKNASKLNNIAVFSDDMRDSIKGSVFQASDKGFVSGKKNCEKGIMFGVMAATSAAGSLRGWAKSPSQCINYASAHDNLTLFDKLTSSTGEGLEAKARMNRLAGAIVLTSQGVPFIHAGEEILRSKVKKDGTLDENSYKSPDSVNSIKWDSLSGAEYMKTHDYYKGLIALRKSIPEFRYTTKDEISSHIWTVRQDKGIVFYYIESDGRDILVIFNGNKKAEKIDLGENTVYDIYAEGDRASDLVINTFTGKNYEIEPVSAAVMIRKTDGGTKDSSGKEESSSGGKKKGCGGSFGGSLAGVLSALAAGIVIKKKKYND